LTWHQHSGFSAGNDDLQAGIARKLRQEIIKELTMTHGTIVIAGFYGCSSINVIALCQGYEFSWCSNGMMKIEVGRRIALAVDSEWYRILQEHRFLKGAAITAHPTDLITASVESLDFPHGIWVKPDEKSSDYPKAAMFIPWRFIFAAVLLDADDEAKMQRGFATF
jgi:hypothetical protein